MTTITSHNRDQIKQKLKQIAINWQNHEKFPTAHIDILYTLCREIDSDYARFVIDCLDNGSLDLLLSKDLDNPSSYMFSSLYQDDLQIKALISKYPYWHIETDPLLEAMKTFIDCESMCRETNIKIMHGSLKNPNVAPIFHMVQHQIASILGKCPSVQELAFEFGPGSTYSVKNNTSALHKLESALDVTDNCYGLAREFLLSCPGWHDNDGSIPSLSRIPGDRLSFVPKNAKTHRPIGIGGLLNSLIQKGVGRHIRRRLKPVLDLNSLQEEHRRLASQASLDQKLATIDLKNASDTISYMIILDLFPSQWFELLDSSRSPCYSIEGNTYSYEKFSAMGNGYTFELETLLFYCIVDSCRRYMNVQGLVSVYGDDIICPTQCVPLVKEVLAVCGFSVNDTKSFSAGPFRESCGGDYFNGFDVRPFFLKDRMNYKNLFLLHNHFVKKGTQFTFPETFRLIRRLLGKDVLKYLSSSESLYDGVIYDPSIPRRSFFFVNTKKVGQRRNADASPFSIAYALYRIQRSPGYWVSLYHDIEKGDVDVFDRRTILKSKVSFHRSI